MLTTIHPTRFRTCIRRYIWITAAILANSATYAADPVGNACPPEGCEINITDAVKSGDELQLVWSANFLPDVSRNHIHVFWDTFKAEEVSSDAEANGFTQGDWVPTSDYPEYLTGGAMSTANRADSTTICVTAANRDHAVLDAGSTTCVDVSEQL